MDIANQGYVQQSLRLDPEIFTGFSFTFGVGDQHRHQLQNVLFAVDVGKGIVVHRLAKVDGIKSPDIISGSD